MKAFRPEDLPGDTGMLERALESGADSIPSSLLQSGRADVDDDYFTDQSETTSPGEPTSSYAIGIDAGSTTGLAVWDGNEEEIVELKTLSFWSCIQHVITEYPPGDDGPTIYIEDPTQIGAIYDRHRGSSGPKMWKIAQNVGAVKRETELLITKFEQLGYVVCAVKPAGKKWDAETCEQITGYNGSPNNQDVRDAIKLVYQR